MCSSANADRREVCMVWMIETKNRFIA